MARKFTIQIVNGFAIYQEPLLSLSEVVDINDEMHFAELFTDKNGKIVYIFDAGVNPKNIKRYKDDERFAEVCDFDVITYNDEPVESFTGSLIDALIYVKNFDDKRFGRRS
ncbi:MAG: hypothetical protein LBU73_03500 [Helicobacteraceae bacterium]|jgi:hypothetical protein|nr:hypothetical protein [Helicobacteraceae bacterium]